MLIFCDYNGCGGVLNLEPEPGRDRKNRRGSQRSTRGIIGSLASSDFVRLRSALFCRIQAKAYNFLNFKRRNLMKRLITVSVSVAHISCPLFPNIPLASL